MAGFFLRLIPPRPTFALDMTPEEREVMLRHVGYWAALAAEGTALAFGPVADPAGGYGIGIVVADTRADVEAIRAADPVTSLAGFRYEIAPMPRLVTPTATHNA